MTSEIKADVILTTRIDRAADPNSSRYTLGNLQATPIDSERVFVTASNGRHLAIVRAFGRLDQERLIPAAVLPKKKIKKGGHKITLNGRWENSDGKFAADEDLGRFPQTADIVPLREYSDCVKVTLDAESLLALRDALNTDQRGLTLYIKPDKAGRVCSSIAVSGQHGIGVLMPLAEDKGADDRYDETRREYMAAKRR